MKCRANTVPTRTRHRANLGDARRKCEHSKQGRCTGGLSYPAGRSVETPFAQCRSERVGSPDRRRSRPLGHGDDEQRLSLPPRHRRDRSVSWSRRERPPPPGRPWSNAATKPGRGRAVAATITQKSPNGSGRAGEDSDQQGVRIRFNTTRMCLALFEYGRATPARVAGRCWLLTGEGGWSYAVTRLPCRVWPGRSSSLSPVRFAWARPRPTSTAMTPARANAAIAHQRAMVAIRL
jgi:hypothetical protein